MLFCRNFRWEIFRFSSFVNSLLTWKRVGLTLVGMIVALPTFICNHRLINIYGLGFDYARLDLLIMNKTELWFFIDRPPYVAEY